ncbi:MAG: universal stress protein [Chloroflexi bacterium]|nr:universal stress protein [Chloroflexota bacterium]
MSSSGAVSTRRLLVALDGSKLAETAVAIACRLASALPAEITLLHIMEHEPPATVHGESHLTTMVEAEAYLARIAGRLQSEGLVATTHVHPNPQRDVAGSIAAHADELGADLIVLAAHGRGGFRDWLVGRIPQLVTARAGRPVLIVPAPSPRKLEAIKRMMVPIDPGGEARAALPIAERLGRALQAELLLLTVIPTPDTVPGEAGVATIFLPSTAASLLDWAEKQTRAELADLAKKLADSGLAATAEVRRGDPARELIEAIARHRVDLVIIATHARAGLDGLLSGSVGTSVVTSAPCPILLVPIRD